MQEKLYLADMVGKQDKTPQLSIFDTPLESFINLNNEACILLIHTNNNMRLAL